MSKETDINKVIMKVIRYTILLSTVAVCIMDIMIQGQLNIMYIFANIMILYFASDSSE